MLLSPQMFAESLAELRRADLSKSDNDRRHHTRLVVQTPLPIWTQEMTQAEAISVLTRDFSMEGLGIFWTREAEAGMAFTVALPRPKRPAYCVACEVKHVRWLAQGLWAVGAVFTAVFDAPPRK